VTPLNVPAAHGLGLDVPAGQYWPAGQAPVQLELVTPPLAPNRPGPHARHTDCAVALLTVPALQLTGVDTPAVQYTPVLHVWQLASVVWPGVGLNLPLGHGI
jgi:hypothetical protein